MLLALLANRLNLGRQRFEKLKGLLESLARHLGKLLQCYVKLESFDRLLTEGRELRK